MEVVIEGIRCRSHIMNLNTGITVPFNPDDETTVLKLHKSFLDQFTAEELRALPRAPKGSVPALEVGITQSGKKIWREV